MASQPHHWFFLCICLPAVLFSLFALGYSNFLICLLSSSIFLGMVLSVGGIGPAGLFSGESWNSRCLKILSSASQRRFQGGQSFTYRVTKMTKGAVVSLGLFSNSLHWRATSVAFIPLFTKRLSVLQYKWCISGKAFKMTLTITITVPTELMLLTRLQSAATWSFSYPHSDRVPCSHPISCKASLFSTTWRLNVARPLCTVDEWSPMNISAAVVA